MVRKGIEERDTNKSWLGLGEIVWEKGKEEKDNGLQSEWW